MTNTCTEISPHDRGVSKWEEIAAFFFLNVFIYIYLRLCWVLVDVRGLSLVAESGGSSSRWLLLLWSAGSRVVGFSSGGAWN